MSGKTNTTKRLSFRKAYEELPAARQRFIKLEMAKKCGWKSNTTFYNKLNEKRNINYLESKVIEVLFSEIGFNAWTGERLN